MVILLCIEFANIAHLNIEWIQLSHKLIPEPFGEKRERKWFWISQIRVLAGPICIREKQPRSLITKVASTATNRFDGPECQNKRNENSFTNLLWNAFCIVCAASVRRRKKMRHSLGPNLDAMAGIICVLGACNWNHLNDKFPLFRLYLGIRSTSALFQCLFYLLSCFYFGIFCLSDESSIESAVFLCVSHHLIDQYSSFSWAIAQKAKAKNSGCF